MLATARPSCIGYSDDTFITDKTVSVTVGVFDELINLFLSQLTVRGSVKHRDLGMTLR